MSTPPGTIGGAHLSSLAEVLARHGCGAPRSCLWVGHNPGFETALSGILRQSGSACAVHAVASTAGARTETIPGAYAAEGHAVGLAECPEFTSVLDFARTQADPLAALRSLSGARRQLRDLAPRALDLIAADFQQRTFDLVVIAGEPILADAIVRCVEGSRAFLIDGVRTSFGGSAAFAKLFSDPAYILAAHDDHEHGGWALFLQRDSVQSELPIHFFTIVLNGEPFIRYHEQMLMELDCPWHWHVVEGVASLVKDTAWSVAAGGHIPSDLHERGKSNDGTTRYLDELRERFPHRVTVYRKPDDLFWDGKLEMVSAPVPNIREKCLLWQIDADELWTADQVHAVRRKFIEEPDRTAAMFWCNYYVGPDKGVSTRLNYAQNPAQEWLRVWRFEPGMAWDKHEPPVLAGTDATGARYDVGQRNPFRHRETEAWGAVFDHFAYSTPEQAQFKESYYGYADAVKQWSALQEHAGGSGHLRDYFAWVHDDTMFDTVERMGWAPLAHIDPNSGQWQFRTPAELAEFRRSLVVRRPIRVVVDGVFFQLASSGIARVWENLLKAWVRSGFADNVVVLDRGKTAPRIDGVLYRTIDQHNWDTVDGDARYLQQICEMEQADLFVSTYYTTPTSTPSVFFGHDMIPERMGFDLDDLWWRQKRRAIQYAAGHIMVSGASADDLVAFHPDVPRDRVLVAHNSVSDGFRPCDEAELRAFRKAHAIDRPFVMLVGERFGWKGYKNAGVVFAALAMMEPKKRPLLVCVGGQPSLEDAGRAFLEDADVRLLQLDDDGLRACFGAALAYICPSKLEGFGLPIAEAMTVGCPALVCANSSIPEVAGDAGIYFDADDPASLVEAIGTAADPTRRASAIAAGREQVKKFDQKATAAAIADYLVKVRDGLAVGAIAHTGQALADAFAEAEQRRAIEREAAELRHALVATKRQLANGNPLRPAELDDRQGGGSHSLAGAGAGHSDLIPLREVQGLQPIEGPYPGNGVYRQLRWQVEPVSRFHFDASRAGEAVFELDFANLEPDQVLRVELAGEEIATISLAEWGWDREWHLALPATLHPGPVEVAVFAPAGGTVEDDARLRHIAVFGVSLRWLE